MAKHNRRRPGPRPAYDPRDNKRRCCRCRTIQPLDHFYLSERTRDGRMTQCIPCTGPSKAAIGIRLRLATYGYKRCANGHIAPITDFGIASDRADGRNKYCRPCKQAIDRTWSQKSGYEQRRWQLHRERRQARNRAYYRANAERLKEQARANWLSVRDDPERHEAFLEKHRNRSRNRRGRVKAVASERIDFDYIYQRDNGRCHMCGKATRLDVPTTAPNRCHYDHVVPLARGGTHTHDNIRVACAPCNWSKRDRAVGDQPMLFG